MKRQKAQPPRFALCLKHEGYPASLEVGKVYRLIPDEQAAAHGYLRIIDESGEDYAFVANRFLLIELPLAAEKALLSHARKIAARSVGTTGKTAQRKSHAVWATTSHR